MPCIIKNVPPQSFKITGNRGVGFPTTDYCGFLPQPEEEDVPSFIALQTGVRYGLQLEDGTPFALE